MRTISKRNVCLVALVLCAALLVGCSRKYVLNDGYYTSTFTEYDASGWKEYVTISVSGGKIASMEYNAVNSAGLLRSWDIEFMREMNTTVQCYPNKFTRAYVNDYLKNSRISDIHALSGATDSYYAFVKLTDAVVISSMAGDADVSIIKR